MKKVFSVLLSLVMLMSLLSVGVAVSAAANAPTADVTTIKGYAGQKISISLYDEAFGISGKYELDSSDVLNVTGVKECSGIVDIGTQLYNFHSDSISLKGLTLEATINSDAKMGDVCIVTFTYTRVVAASPLVKETNVVKKVKIEVVNKDVPTETSKTTKPPLSGNADLESLVPSKGSLVPAFAPDITDYTISVPYEVTSLSLSATPDHSAAYIAVSGKNALEVGQNTRVITVTAPNGTTKKYTVVIVRSSVPETTATSMVATPSASVSGGISSTSTTTKPSTTTTKKTTVATSTTAAAADPESDGTSGITEAVGEAEKTTAKSPSKKDGRKEDKDTNKSADHTRILLLVGVLVVAVGVLTAVVYVWFGKK